MILNQTETNVVKNLQAQEKSCIQKYDKYSQEAKDPELKNLFQTLKHKEQEHYQSLSQLLDGTIAKCDCNDADGKNYNPKATYTDSCNASDKDHDCFLATDCIGTEKLVSSEYNTNIFAFGNSDVRKLFADIQIEEQNHAEMIYKYKTANQMT